MTLENLTSSAPRPHSKSSDDRNFLLHMNSVQYGVTRNPLVKAMGAGWILDKEVEHEFSFSLCASSE